MNSDHSRTYAHGSHVRELYSSPMPRTGRYSARMSDQLLRDWNITINAKELRASLPKVVERVRRGARFTVLYRLGHD